MAKCVWSNAFVLCCHERYLALYHPTNTISSNLVSMSTERSAARCHSTSSFRTKVVRVLSIYLSYHIYGSYWVFGWLILFRHYFFILTYAFEKLYYLTPWVILLTTLKRIFEGGGIIKCFHKHISLRHVVNHWYYLLPHAGHNILLIHIINSLNSSRNLKSRCTIS